jgi:RNA polymerase sigma factor (sigma-70 family)
MITERVHLLLPLADKIAREFDNIPGLPHEEILLTAQEALAHAARLYDPAKGDFTAYASRSMRNALRDLYERQVRHHKHHLYGADFSDQPSTRGEPVAFQALPRDYPMVELDLAAQESNQRLEIAMKVLSPKLRTVAEGLRDGKSYREIGVSLGISKQAAHKLAGAAIASLKEQLELMGFSGIDTMGFLKSCQPKISDVRAQVDDYPSQP